MSSHSSRKTIVCIATALGMLLAVCYMWLPIHPEIVALGQFEIAADDASQVDASYAAGYEAQAAHDSPESEVPLEAGSSGQTSDYAHVHQALGDRQKWLNHLGYFDADDKAAYESYNDETLNALGVNGDLLALSILAAREFNSGHHKKAQETMSMAVMHGSLAAMAEMSMFDQARIYQLSRAPEHDIQAIRETAISAAAWFEAAASLGNLRAVSIGNVTLAETKVRFSDDDRAAITALALERVEIINASRSAVGLDPIEPVALPDGLQENVFESMRYSLRKNPSGWGSQYLEKEGSS